jgi:hypothetical protein
MQEKAIIKRRVRILGAEYLQSWTKTMQEQLPGKEGTTIEYKADYGFGDGSHYLVELDEDIAHYSNGAGKKWWIHIDALHFLS